MTDELSTDEVSVKVSNLVATVEIHRPPHNYFDFALIQQLADIYEALAARSDCRAVSAIPSSQSAGANLTVNTPRSSWITW